MTDIFDESQMARETIQDNPRLGQVLITRTEIAQRIKELAEEIVRNYDHRDKDFELIIVAIMTGSLIFLADLVRAIPLPIRIAIMIVSNYPGTSTQAQGVRINYDLKENVQGKDVLVVDDILDTGQTLSAVVNLLGSRGAKSVRTCVLLNKMIGKDKNLSPDFVGFEIPNKFVVGYGLDYDNLYRNYPQIAVLEG
jgi:hypoxanthine phosphoribosyltransferase